MTTTLCFAFLLAFGGATIAQQPWQTLKTSRVADVAAHFQAPPPEYGPEPSPMGRHEPPQQSGGIAADSVHLCQEVLVSRQPKPPSSGVKTCPAVRGATNWYSPAFSPHTGLVYVMAVEDCGLYRQAKQGGFGFLNDPADPAMKYLRALDIQTGKIVWEIPQIGPVERNYSGVLATAGGLVFYGESSGAFAGVDAKAGKSLWHFETNNAWKASPMTYLACGRQYVAIASGSSIYSFAVAP